MVTAYDAPGAAVALEAGVDVVLVGDSVAMVVLGHGDTLSVTLDEMVHHTAAVARGLARAGAAGVGGDGGTAAVPLLVADMPWLSYHLGAEDSVRNAARLVRAGAAAVKLEGGRKRLATLAALSDAEIPVMGHLGLTPQSVHVMGGYRVQGREPAAAEGLVADALALAGAGCFAIVLEGVPATAARAVTEAVDVPTIGIGAGPHCDGQVLVFHDLLGLVPGDRPAPRFVRRYASLGAEAVTAVARFAADVRAGRFPAESETYPADGAGPPGASMTVVTPPPAVARDGGPGACR